MMMVRCLLLAIAMVLGMSACNAPADAACPNLGEAIAQSFTTGVEFQINEAGNAWVYGKEPGGQSCAVTIGDKGQYIFETLVGDEKLSSRTETPLVGEWYFGSVDAGGHTGYLTFTETPSGNIEVGGDSAYTNSAGSVAVGYFEGEMERETDVKTATARVRLRSQESAEKSNDCYLDLRQAGNLLVVLDSGAPLGRCSGENVSFTGVYARKAP
jgi:putative hemolysin